MARKVRREEQYSVAEPNYSYSYSIPPIEQPQPFFKRKHRLTSITEVRDIAAAVALLSAALYIIWYVPDHKGVLYYALLAVLSVVTGFLVHEMSHKLFARAYGCWAEFRADYRMLGLAVVMSFFGFLWAAPGAVMIIGNIDTKQNGKISLAGPASNLLVVAGCLPLWITATSASPQASIAVVDAVYFFNVFLGAFNMIPIMPFDGAKIWRWNKMVYAGTLLAAGLMLLLWLQGHGIVSF